MHLDGRIRPTQTVRFMARQSPTPKPVALNAETRILVLYGHESMLKQLRFEEMKSIIQRSSDLDVIYFDGTTVDLAQVLDELRTQSLFQPHKIVVVDEAEQFVTAHRAALERYAKAPSTHATLVMRGERWNRGNLDKVIQRVGAVIKCEPLKERDAEAWLMNRAQICHQTHVSTAAASALVARLGTDLSRLDSEVAKLALRVETGQSIEPKHVSELVGRSSDEQAWEVQEALLAALQPGRQRDPRLMATAVQKMHDLVQLAGQSDILISYFVADFFRRLSLAQAMHEQGTPDAVIGRALRFWGPRQGLFMNVVRRLDKQSAGRLLDRSIEMDRRAKSGLGTALRNLDRFFASLTREFA